MLKVPADNFAPICKIPYVEVEDMTGGDPPIYVNSKGGGLAHKECCLLVRRSSGLLLLLIALLLSHQRACLFWGLPESTSLFQWQPLAVMNTSK